jgi:hypothetical protein
LEFFSAQIAEGRARSHSGWVWLRSALPGIDDHNVCVHRVSRWPAMEAPESHGILLQAGGYQGKWVSAGDVFIPSGSVAEIVSRQGVRTELLAHGVAGLQIATITPRLREPGAEVELRSEPPMGQRRALPDGKVRARLLHCARALVTLYKRKAIPPGLLRGSKANLSAVSTAVLTSDGDVLSGPGADWATLRKNFGRARKAWDRSRPHAEALTLLIGGLIAYLPDAVSDTTDGKLGRVRDKIRSAWPAASLEAFARVWAEVTG